jgi:hypothetical protein
MSGIAQIDASGTLHHAIFAGIERQAIFVEDMHGGGAIFIQGIVRFVRHCSRKEDPIPFPV